MEHLVSGPVRNNLFMFADAGDVTEVVPLADKSCTLSIIQRVVEYLKKHAEFEATHADDETILAFDKQFQEQSDEIIFQTILAANFLDIKNLLELMVSIMLKKGCLSSHTSQIIESVRVLILNVFLIFVILVIE